MKKENVDLRFALLRKGRGFNKFLLIDDESTVFSLRWPAWLWSFQKMQEKGARISLPLQVSCYRDRVFWGVFVVKNELALKRIKITRRDRFGYIKLIAVESDPVTVIKKWGMNVHISDDWPLRWAAKNGDCDLALALLACGANIHAKEDDPLRKAASTNQAGMTRLLLGFGANAFARHCGAYEIAKAGNHKETAAILHQHLSDPKNF